MRQGKAAAAPRRAVVAIMAVALISGMALLVALPGKSHGDGGLSALTDSVGKTVQTTVSNVSSTVQQVTAPVQQVVQQATAPVAQATQPVQQAVQQVTAPVQQAVQNVQKATQQTQQSPTAPAAAPRPSLTRSAPAQRQAAATDPTTDPPLHGTNPHGEGTVATVDIQPSADRPYADDPTGKANGEEVVLGRTRGEQNADGTYHGHITVLALFGNEIIGVDSTPGQTKHGPLDALQTQVLDQICDSSGKQLCLSVLTADSTTTSSGSTNHFSLAHATIGGASGLDLGAAESDGNISGDSSCQTATGASHVANLNAGGGQVVAAGNSTTQSTACANGTNSEKDSSQLLSLGGTGVPLPAAGCADGTPDTVTGIPTLLPIVCNAADPPQAPVPTGVRDALDIFAISMGQTSVAKVGVASSESHAVAPGTPPNCQPTACPSPPPACSTPPCPPTTPVTPNGPTTPTGPGTNGNGNGNGNGVAPSNTAGKKPQCSDGIDNDNDGLIDYPADPGCSSASDNSEANGHGNGNGNNGNGPSNANGGPGAGNNGNGNGNGPAATLNAGANGNHLPFTGTNVLELAIAGLLALGSGIAMRRRLTAS